MVIVCYVVPMLHMVSDNSALLKDGKYSNLIKFSLLYSGDSLSQSSNSGAHDLV